MVRDIRKKEFFNIREELAYKMGLKCGKNDEPKSKYEPLIRGNKILERWFTIGLLDGIKERREGAE